MFSKRSASSLTGFHDYPSLFLEPAFNIREPFTENMIREASLKMMAKVALITVASAGFGVAMGLLMSSFESNSA